MFPFICSLINYLPMLWHSGRNNIRWLKLPWPPVSTTLFLVVVKEMMNIAEAELTKNIVQDSS